MLQTRESSTAKSPPKMRFSFAASAAPGAADDALRHATESTTSTTAPRGRAPFRPSQEADSTGPCEPESRLQHLIRHRYYDPRAGRFTAEDPMGRGEENLYAYVGNDPVNSVDPTGLSRIKDCWNCYKYSRQCTKDVEECRRRHADPEVCLERGENDVGDASGHLLRVCAKDKIPSCLKAVWYCKLCLPAMR